MRAKLTPIDGDITNEFAGVKQEVRDEPHEAARSLPWSMQAAWWTSTRPSTTRSTPTPSACSNLVALCRDLGASKARPASRCSTRAPATWPATARARSTRSAPLSHPFPKAGELDVSKHWDAENEIAECRRPGRQPVRHRANDAFRQNAFLDEAKKNLGATQRAPARLGPREGALQGQAQVHRQPARRVGHGACQVLGLAQHLHLHQVHR